MKTILITGSKGFIGRRLKSKLKNIGYKVLEFDIQDGDIADENALQKYNHYHIDHVVHLVAKTFVPQSWESPFGFYNTNIMGTVNVLQFCRNKVIDLTYISSYLYGSSPSLPISEDDKLQPNNPYAHSKYLAEELCRFYNEQFDMNITVFRPFNAYGIGQDKKFLIPKIIDQVLKNDVITLMNLSSKRDYIYIEDLIDAIIASISTKHKFGIYNIGSGISLSVQNVIDTIQDIFGTHKEIICEKIERQNEVDDVVANIDLAKRELNWSPKYTLRKGIEEMYLALMK